MLRIVLVATFARWKGHDVCLTALATLPASLHVRGYIVGGPLYETTGSQISIAELRELARSLGLEDRIGFTGFVQDSSAAMRSLDIVVHASTDPEPFGLVIAEAMACGKPVVVSRAGGASELIGPGVNALAFEPGDGDGLARCLDALARDAGLRQRLGRAGRSTAEQRFHRRRMAGERAPIYQTLAVH